MGRPPDSPARPAPPSAPALLVTTQSFGALPLTHLGPSVPPGRAGGAATPQHRLMRNVSPVPLEETVPKAGGRCQSFTPEQEQAGVAETEGPIQARGLSLDRAEPGWGVAQGSLVSQRNAWTPEPAVLGSDPEGNQLRNCKQEKGL